MRIVDELKAQITAGRIKFDPPAATAARLKRELLGESSGTKVTERLQKLVLEASKVVAIQISSIVREGGLHGEGRAFDVGNETVAADLLPTLATKEKVRELGIDEIIFDAAVAGESDRNKWNYDQGKKWSFSEAELNAHRNHIHFAVTKE